MSDEFQLFVPPVVNAGIPVVEPTTAAGSITTNDRFTVPGLFLEALWGDAAFREQWDQVIEDRVQKRFASEHEELRAQATAVATELGIQLVMKAAGEKVAAAETKLAQVSQQLMVEKEALLHSHERAWCNAMLHVLRRFLIRRPEELVSVLQAWIDDCLKGFSQNAKVRIYLSEDDHAALSQALSFRPERSAANHDFAVDRNLSTGELRCECDGGGIFFSPNQELSELEAYLDGIFNSENTANEAA